MLRFSQGHGSIERFKAAFETLRSSPRAGRHCPVPLLPRPTQKAIRAAKARTQAVTTPQISVATFAPRALPR
jgi:hypothetical protein